MQSEPPSGTILAPRTWLSPITLVTIADPSPVVTLTLIPPIMLHTMIYHSMLFVPYLRQRQPPHARTIPLYHSLWRKIEHDDKRRRDEHRAVRKEARREEHRLELGDLADRRLLRTCTTPSSAPLTHRCARTPTIERNDDRANLTNARRGEFKFVSPMTSRAADRAGRTMHSPQPSQPKKPSFSWRKKCDRIAHITTDSAPIGV